MAERYKMSDVQNAFPSCSNKRFQESFKSQNIRYGAGRRCFDNVCMPVCVHLCFSSASACVCVCVLKMYLALATHSMIASFRPMVTLVFLGGMMMDGAMGSAGPPTSNTHRSAQRQMEKCEKIYI